MPREAALLLLAAACVASVVRCGAQDETTDERIVYAPDIVGVDRLCMVVLNVPQAAPEIAVTVPECLTLLDRTPLPARGEQRRYYFRAVERAEAPAPLNSTFTSSIFLPVTSSALMSAAPEMIAVPCWSS